MVTISSPPCLARKSAAPVRHLWSAKTSTAFWMQLRYISWFGLCPLNTQAFRRFQMLQIAWGNKTFHGMLWLCGSYAKRSVCGRSMTGMRKEASWAAGTSKLFRKDSLAGQSLRMCSMVSGWSVHRVHSLGMSRPPEGGRQVVTKKEILHLYIALDHCIRPFWQFSPSYFCGPEDLNWWP